jgi:hypothetical protein
VTIDPAWLAAAAAGVGAVSALVAATAASRARAQLNARAEELERAIQAHPSTESSFDVFVSYASADSDFADDLARALRERGLSVWYADHELKIGDSIAQKVADGLARSRYGVVVLSPAFLRGAWPQKELSVFTKREADGESKIFPIWNDLSEKDVREYFPSLADIVAMQRGKESVDEMADKIAATVASSDADS